uniref:DUF7041 domain-containing protein n=1 Tax=Glossina pallidipes TaxID=7398 RepID=A0A1B0A3Q8_GLOPL
MIVLGIKALGAVVLPVIMFNFHYCSLKSGFSFGVWRNNDGGFIGGVRCTPGSLFLVCVAKIVSPPFGHKMQRTSPTAPVYSNNTNDIIDLIFDNNNALQNINTSEHIKNTHTPNESLSINREILACSVKLSLFWSNCSETCFIQTEAQFASKGITQDTTKYEDILLVLPQKLITSTADFIRDPPANKYEGGVEVSVLPLAKFPNNNKSSDNKLTAENVSNIITFGKKLLNINLNPRRNFPFAFLIADISRPIITADFVSKHGPLVDVKRTRLVDSLTNIAVIA